MNSVQEHTWNSDPKYFQFAVSYSFYFLFSFFFILILKVESATTEQFSESTNHQPEFPPMSIPVLTQHCASYNSTGNSHRVSHRAGEVRAMTGQFEKHLAFTPQLDGHRLP